MRARIGEQLQVLGIVIDGAIRRRRGGGCGRQGGRPLGVVAFGLHGAAGERGEQEGRGKARQGDGGHGGQVLLVMVCSIWSTVVIALEFIS
jgi:hypothetical protein